MSERVPAPEADEDNIRLLNSAAIDLEAGEAGDAEKHGSKLPVESAASKNFMKNVSLALLSIQNCAMILSMKYSKTYVPPGGKPYISTTAVIVVANNNCNFSCSADMRMHVVCRARSRS